MGKVANWLIIAAMLLLVFGLNLNFKATNNDIFFHVKTGEYIISNKEFPKQDIFSHTAVDHEWTAHEWAPAVIFYFFYNNFGFESLIFLKAVILVIIFFFFFKLMDNNFYLALILTIFAAFATKTYAYIRPHIFFWLFLIFFFYLFKHKKHYLLPILTLVWANFHSSVIIGLIVITIYLLELFIIKKQVKYLLLTAACFLTSLINPYTYKLFLLPFTILNLSADINEWRPYTIDSPWFWFYLIFIITIGLILILSKKKIKLSNLLIILLFTILGFKSKRYVASSIIVNIIVIQPYLNKLIKKTKRSFKKDLFFVIVVFLLLFFSILKLNAFNPEVPWKYMGSNVIDFVKKNNLEGNMYNTYRLGGPVIFSLYPEYKVFIDGRIDVYGKDIVDDYYDIRYGENWEQLVEEYNIDFLIIDDKADIGKILLKDSNYKLVFFDENYLVYIQDIPKYQNIKKFEFINPYYALDPKNDTENIINEMEYLLNLDKDNLNAYKNLGIIYYFEKNNNEKALYYLNEYLDKNTKDKDIKALKIKIENEDK